MILTCKLCEAKFEANHYNTLCPNCRTRKCLICGKEFKVVKPYTQVTCSKVCAGVYRKKSGISKEVYRKASSTMKERYGVSNARDVTKPTEPKICPICGESFIPDTFRQVYCKKPHYGPCPVCGKEVQIKELYIGPQCCSEDCKRARTKKTVEARFGCENVMYSDAVKMKMKRTFLSRYGVPHPHMLKFIHNKTIATMISRYGAGHPLQVQEIKDRVQKTNMERYGGITPTYDKTVVQKILNTQCERYGGVGFDSPVTKEKIHKTMLDRFGTTKVMSVPEILEKAKLTNIERYGDTTPARSPEVIAKRENTMLQKYGVKYLLQDEKIRDSVLKKLRESMQSRFGVDNPSQVPEYMDKMAESNMKKYGVPWTCLLDKCTSANIHNRISKVNESFSRRLIQLGYIHIMEYKLERKSYDIMVCNMLIEIDPTITHNSAMSVFHSSGAKPSDYHLAKTEIARKHGFRCVHIFDWDDTEKILGMLKHYIVVYARSCELRKVPKRDAEAFIEKYHLQGSCRGQYLCYGLYYNDELIEVMTFGKPRYNHKYTYELLRLCTAFGYRVVGGASKLFHKFTVDNPKCSVISYCNASKFTGDVYLKIGMKLAYTTKPAKIWSKGTRYITDNMLRQRGYDQLFGTDFGKGTSNESLMLESGWLPVYDCGQYVYEYKPQ